MNRSKHILGLVLHRGKENKNSPILVEEQNTEMLHNMEHSSPTKTLECETNTEVHRESPLTVQQQTVIAEMRNIDFSDDEIEDDIPFYLNKSPPSVLTTNKDFEQETNIPSVENQLTPLFTPIPSVHSLESPNIIDQTYIEDSDDSIADPSYQPEDEKNQCSPMSPVASLIEPSVRNINSPQIDELSTHENEPSVSNVNSPQIEQLSTYENEPSVCNINSPQIEELSTSENNPSCQEVKRHKRKVPENWKKNIRKKKRNNGETYRSAKGKNVPAKKCGIENCKCQRLCHTKIDNNARETLHLSFWSLGSLERQRDFIVSNVNSTEAVNSRVNNSRRKYTLSYSFKIDSNKITVCQPFFLSTLDISDKMVRTALKKARRGVGSIPSPDKRGRHTPSNKLDTDDLKFANDHIDSFPKVPSHWCRKDTKKIYLETALNKEKMYDLYKQFCLENNKNAIGKTSYKELILKKNIGFHKPRKDQCWCNKYEQLTEDEQKEKQEEYEEHINRKYFAQEEKKSDKIKAKVDKHFQVCTFDFEAVLYSPLVLGKPVFYKRKLGSMNFTIHNAGTKQGYCYFWPEYEGNRGSNEVSTCLYKYITNLSDVDHLVLYSDCCPGQNRNSVVATMLNYIISSPDNHIKVIDYKFLEPGHTYMECDNMHSTIERASEYAKIYTPDDWQNVIRLARKDNPYNVQVMEHTDFLDFKAIGNNIFPNKIKATDGTPLHWANVRWLQFNKEFPNSLFFKCEYWEEFKEVKLKERSKRSERNTCLAKLYPEQILLKRVKHSDLMEMCKDGTIPKNHHFYYQNLPVNSRPLEKMKPQNDDDELELSASRASYLRRRSGKKN